jgi:hypothetical protein
MQAGFLGRIIVASRSQDGALKKLGKGALRISAKKSDG